MSDSQIRARKKKNVRNHIFLLNGKAIDKLIYDCRQCFDALWLDECINILFDAGVKDMPLYGYKLQPCKAGVPPKYYLQLLHLCSSLFYLLSSYVPHFIDSPRFLLFFYSTWNIHFLFWIRLCLTFEEISHHWGKSFITKFCYAYVRFIFILIIFGFDLLSILAWC